MRRQPNNIRWREFQLQNKQRQIAQLDVMIEEFTRMIRALEEQTGAQGRTIHHFVTATIAQAARQRRDNLVDSVENLKKQRAALEVELSDLETSHYQGTQFSQGAHFSAGHIMV